MSYVIVNYRDKGNQQIQFWIYVQEICEKTFSDDISILLSYLF